MTKKQQDMMKKIISKHINDAWEDGAREERQNVVAWLRGPIDGVIEEACLVAAAMIERGEHVKQDSDDSGDTPC